MRNETSSAVSEFVREWIGEQRGKVPRVTFVHLGEQLGCTHSHVIGILKGRAAGPVVEEAFAKLHFGGSVDAMRAAAKKWWGEMEERTWPHLEEAIDFRGAKWSKRTVETMRNIGRQWPVDRTVGAWIDDGDRIEIGESGERVRSSGLRALNGSTAALPPKRIK